MANSLTFLGAAGTVTGLHLYQVNVVEICVGRHLEIRCGNERQSAATCDRESRLIGAAHYRNAPAGYVTALSSVNYVLQSKIQDLILKDIVSARDEATPPEFKELVDRYYEVLSKESGKK